MAWTPRRIRSAPQPNRLPEDDHPIRTGSRASITEIEDNAVDSSRALRRAETLRPGGKQPATRAPSRLGELPGDIRWNNMTIEPLEHSD